MRIPFVPATFLAMMTLAGVAAAQAPTLPDFFAWKTSGPLLSARPVDNDEKYSIKDPSIVFHEGRWHLFATVRGKTRSHAIIYVAFRDWDAAAQAEWRVLPNHEGFFCAPQVFYFRPHQKWYLICQASSEQWEPNYRPAFATTETLSDAGRWTKLQPLRDQPAGVSAWLDFWVICDETHAYLFFTSLDGKMWRCQTEIDQFPAGWSEPVVALEGDLFEASHTYRLRGVESGHQYLTVVEAQGGHGWRYYKAYLAERLDGDWRPLAATRENAFASLKNVAQVGARWTDAISHGELLRASHDERLEVEPGRFRFLIQGCLDTDRGNKPYGQIPWRLGLLEQQ